MQYCLNHAATLESGVDQPFDLIYIVDFHRCLMSVVWLLGNALNIYGFLGIGTYYVPVSQCSPET